MTNVNKQLANCLLTGQVCCKYTDNRYAVFILVSPLLYSMTCSIYSNPWLRCMHIKHYVM